MRVKLISDSYYDFYKIRSVKLIDNEKIIISGNLNSGGRYKNVELFIKMLEVKSFNKIMKFCKDTMDVLVYIGLCPNCDSNNILVHEKNVTRREVNKPKARKKEYQSHVICYQCGRCKKTYKELDLKECYVVVYYA